MNQWKGERISQVSCPHRRVEEPLLCLSPCCWDSLGSSGSLWSTYKAPHSRALPLMFLGFSVSHAGPHTGNLFFSDQNAFLLCFLLDTREPVGQGRRKALFVVSRLLYSPGPWGGWFPRKSRLVSSLQAHHTLAIALYLEKLWQKLF